MPVFADFHLHSSYSGDSDTPMEEMILQGIQQGLSAMCFTEHNDFGYPDFPGEPGERFLLAVDSYLYELLRLRDKYRDRISVLFGVELGLQPEVMRSNAILAKSYDFDFIIGSSHLCHGKDPYYPSFYEGRSEEEAYREYFTSIAENIRKFSNFDVYGHLDYVVRYGPCKDAHYTYEKYKDILDTILMLLIENGKGIELNTAGLRSGLREQHPCTDLLKRYRALGGEIITIGSDAHTPDAIASHFDKASQVLLECGFGYYTTFEKRVAQYHKLL